MTMDGIKHHTIEIALIMVRMDDTSFSLERRRYGASFTDQ